MKLLFENFDKIIDSPNGIEKARELVLQLAVQGKLTEQWRKENPNVEPVSELLKKIKIEKERLIKDGVIKKHKEISQLKEENNSSIIPESWECEYLGIVSHITMGQSPASKSYNKIGDGLPFFQGKSEFGAFFPIPQKWCNDPKKLAYEDDILISVRAPVGPTNICKETSCIGRGLASISTLRVYDNYYLLYFLRAIQSKIEAKGVGSTFKAISLSQLYGIKILLPPVVEQNLIVQKIDTLMTFLDELEEKRNRREEKRVQFNTSSLDKLVKSKDEKEFKLNWNRITDNFDKLYSVTENVDKLKQTILQLAVQGKLTEQWRKENPNVEPASELLKKIKVEKEKLIKEVKIKKQNELPPIKEEEKPFELSESWEWVRLGDIGETQTGITPATKEPLNYGEYIPFIGPGDIKNGVILFGRNSLSEQGLSNARLIRSNSILMVCIGGSIGKSVINEFDVTCNQQINTLSPFLTNQTKYIYYVFISDYFQSEVLRKASGSATPIINKNKWENLFVPLAPQKEMEEIEKQVEKLFIKCNMLENQIELKQQEQEKLVEAVVSKLAS